MVLRATLVVLCIVLGLALFSSGEEYGWILAATVGVVVAGVALGIEYTLRRAKPGAVLGGTAGLACGLLLAGLAAWVLEITIPSVEVVPVLGFLFVAIFPYLGLIYGVKIFTAAGILGQPGAVETGGMASTSNKILDTSVIIDGRVADLCETGFLEGAFILPQFILNELQHIADSSDPLKRGRGRRGLFVLKEGKEAGQGVAYLDDGTMIVVDNAKRFIGSNVNVVVTSVLQTQAGRMIFARLKEETEGQETPVARS